MRNVCPLPSLHALLFLFLVVTAQLAAASVTPPSSVKIGLPADLPPAMRLHVQGMVEQLNAELAGKFSTRIVDNDGTDPKDVPQIRFVDLADGGPDESPYASIFDAIFAFENMHAVENFLDSKAGKQVRRVADGDKRVTLSYWHDGMMQLVAGPSGRVFADTGIPGKDNRLFREPFTSVLRAQFSSLGFTGEFGNTDLRFSMLAAGAVDYVEASWDEIAAAGGPRSLLTGSTIIVTNHRYKGYLMVADAVWFKTLPREIRAVLSKEGHNWARRHNALVTATEEVHARRFAVPSTIHLVRMRLEARARTLKTLRDRQAPAFAPNKLLGHARGTRPHAALDAPQLPSSPKFWNDWMARSAAYIASLSRDGLEQRVEVTGSHIPQFSTPPAQKELAIAAWRTWLEDDDGTVYTAEVGREYDLNLALSRRSARSLVDAGPDLKSAIDTAVRQGKKVLPLSIRPVALSGGLQLMAANIQLPLKVQLKRLEIQSEEEEEKESDARDNEQNKGQSESSIAKMFDAAIMSVHVKANPGVACAQILFSVWDEKGIEPLDMLVATIPISQNGRSADCNMPSLQGGFGSFLGVAESAPAHDAGLSLFEYQYANELRTVAMFVSGTEYSHSMAEQPILERGVYVWFLDRPLSGFIDTDLSGAVVAARSDGHYEIPADHLAKTLFPPANVQAQKALKDLQNIVASKESSAWIYVRSARANGKYFYPPLALLAAQGGTLSKRPMFVYPLPMTRPQDESCIGTWKAVIPEKLDGEVVEVDEIDQPGRMEAIRKIDGFRAFLNASPPQTTAMTAQGSATEGLLLLAHHDNGNLWFSDNGTKDVVLPSENNRIFARGSAAILNACHTVSGIGYNQDLIEKFNRNGMDAMLVTPFAMDTDYGEHFAREMVKAIHRVYNEGKGVTLAALMDQVAQEVIKDPTSGKDAQRMLEMVFVGNPTVHLCDKP